MALDRIDGPAPAAIRGPDGVPGGENENKDISNSDTE